MNDNDALRFDKNVYDAACVLEQSAPLDLNEWHFAQLAIISPAVEARAREAQKQAQLAIVHANAEKSATLHTKAAEPKARVPMMGTLSQDAVAEAIAQTIKAALAKQHETWEQKYRTLETRLLELEAQRATVNQ